MIELSESVRIEASPERVFDWLSRFCEHYREWHPDHVSCRRLRGSGLEVGSIIAVEERLHGTLHHLTMTVTEVEPPGSVDYSIGPAVRGRFVVRPEGDGVEFTALLRFGIGSPVLGFLLDSLAVRMFGRRLVDLQRHMAEEGRNLKRMLEATTG